MPVDPKWLLPTDDPRVRRNRAEVLAFTTLAAAPEPAPAPPRPRPDPASTDLASTDLAAPARRQPPAVDPARVQALLDAAPEAGPLRGDPAGTRRELLDLYAELDHLARRLAGSGSGG